MDDQNNNIKPNESNNVQNEPSINQEDRQPNSANTEPNISSEQSSSPTIISSQSSDFSEPTGASPLSSQAAPSTTTSEVKPSINTESQGAQPIDTVKVTTSDRSPKSKRSTVKFILIAVLILVLAGGAYCALKQTVLKPKTTVTAQITYKEIPLLRTGTISGPIGVGSIFPNPAQTLGSQSANYLTFEGLIGFSGSKLIPLLASSWTTPDKNTWVFTLNKNVKFHNGKIMTPADVKSSIEADMQNSFWSQYTQTIKSVAVSGPNSVTITTNAPDALMLGRLASVFIYSVNPDGSFSGTGPYEIDTTKPSTDSTVTIKAFDDYHSGKALTRAIQYTAYNDSPSIDSDFKSGKLDVMEDNGDPKMAAYVKSINGTTLSYQNEGSFGVYMNIKRPNGVMSNIKIREALSYAFDRDALLKQLVGVYEPAYSMIPKTVVGYDSSVTYPGLDIAKSKALQASAGYPGGVPITFLYIKGLQIDPPILIPQLEAAGFIVTPVAVSNPTDMIAAIAAGKFDIISQAYVSSFNDATDIYTQALDGANSDFDIYESPEFDALLNASNSEFDPAAHIQKVQAITSFIYQNMLAIPLRYTESSVYVKQGFESVLTNYSQNYDTTNYRLVGQQVTTSTKQ